MRMGERESEQQNKNKVTKKRMKQVTKKLKLNSVLFIEGKTTERRNVSKFNYLFKPAQF